MSEQKPITKVPDGHARFLTTRQMAPNAKGFVGYETVWKTFQKEVPYQTPKKPQSAARGIDEPGIARQGRETGKRAMEKAPLYHIID